MSQASRSISTSSLSASALCFALSVSTLACGGATPDARAPSASPAPAPTTTLAASPPAPAPPPAPPTPAPPAMASASARPSSPPIDPKVIADATGVAEPEKSPDGVIKASWPRKDVSVAVDGWKVPPFMGLTSWAAFSPGTEGVAEAMVMGDLVLFEDEVNPVMSKLLGGGVQVTALHNHFFYDSPKVFFMHIGGEGKAAELGRAVKAAMDEVASIRKKARAPVTTFGAPKLADKSSIDAGKLDGVFGSKGQSKDGMYKGVFGRDVTASCGCKAGKAMGVNTWAGFAGTDESAVVDGDFAVSESELQPVLKALRGGGIDIVAIHHHMTGEEPRVLFLHYWGRGKAVDLATVVKKALDLTAWDHHNKSI